jgi:predicted hotdog family 3-hydroxylacyl-ACP dehydratase
VRAFHDEQGMGVFSCHIQGNGVQAQARLNVFSPPDANAFGQQTSGKTLHD